MFQTTRPLWPKWGKAGTPGKVVGVSGLSWIRYRVQFANGVERNLVDAKHLRARKDS